MDETLLAEINQAHGTTFRLGQRYADGEQGAYALVDEAGAPFVPTMRHIALEGRCFVLSACQFARRCNFPPDVTPVQGDDLETVLIRGGSCIISPLGEVLAGPVFDEPAILTAPSC